MAQKTDLNIAPYYDDFNGANNYVKTLFRPGFAIQARELTQLQSQLQHQIEQHGSHVFQEGAQVIPGQISVNQSYYSLKLASNFAGETVDPSQYYNATAPVIITGATTGVTAEVVGFDIATTTDQPTLYIRYFKSGNDNEVQSFEDGENISANTGITHTSSYSSDTASTTAYTSVYSYAKGSTRDQVRGSTGPASATGSAAIINAGVYYVRGFFVECAEEILILDKYKTGGNYRVGFTVTETLVTPETTSSLLDNATGSSNYAAKGAHRLKISLALAKLAMGSAVDANFIELLTTRNGQIQSIVDKTEYAILEKNLARRTFDESGDYTVRPFTFTVRESVTLNDNVGLYSNGALTDGGLVASNSLLALEASPGKAYVGGYELEKVAPTIIDLNKSREFESVNAGTTLFGMGNFIVVNNMYGTPDITSISGETTAYKTISLYDEFIGTSSGERGSVPVRNAATPLPIGQCRARVIEYDSGTVGTVESKYKVYLFDIRMFTFLTLSDTPSATLVSNFANGGVKITGSDSGATGYVVNSVATTTGTRLVVMKITGRFSAGETFTASDSAEGDKIVENAANVNLTIVSSEGVVDDTRRFDETRSLVMVDSDSGQNFTANVFLQEPRTNSGDDNSLQANGADAGGADANAKIGESSESIGLESSRLARLEEVSKNNALEKLPKAVIKTLLTDANSGVTDTQYTVRRQFIGTCNSSGVVSFSAGSNETFLSHAEKDYTMSILTAGGGTGVQGQLVSIADTMSGAGGTTLTITDGTILGSAAKVKVTATILKTSVVSKIKTTKLMKQLKVSAGTSDAYGTRPDDADISLGRADVFNLVGVFDSQDTDEDAVAPTLTLGTITGTFTRGETITGSSSGAKGRIIGTSSPVSYVSTNSFEFVVGESISGLDSTASCLVTALTSGDLDITRKFTLDSGMRDNFYDTARIFRKKGSSAPIGKLLVLYDYLEHGTGDMFTVDSYSDIAGQMTYDDIPIYTGSKIDPTDPSPSGKFPLIDSYDFRPRVDDVAGTSATLTVVDEITGNSFNFYERSFEGTGGSTVDFPKPGSFIQSDFEYFLPKYAAIVITRLGKFQVIQGTSSDTPLIPKIPDETMLLCTLFIPAYTFFPRNVTIKRQKHQRYTMRDIGKLARRIDHIEYYTALSLLERDAESFEITDANGLNRFKSGFMVDNFKGHRIGDTAHKDYKNSMDFELGQVRPTHKTKAIDLVELATSDNARTVDSYQKTGDLITLPYTEVKFTEQPYATRIERVNPFLVASWSGTITLSPNSDTWFETEVLPDLIVNEEGDYDAVLANEKNNLGTVWNSWQTQWSGVVETKTDNWVEGGHQFKPDRFDVTRTTNTVRTDQTRTGVDTQVSLRVDRVSQGERVISTAAIPVVRSRTISFTGESFRPQQRLYAFFNTTSINKYITPSSGYSSDSPITAGSPLVSDATGDISGSFLIPDPKVAGNPKWATGQIIFKLTSSSHGGQGTTEHLSGTQGSTSYYASGMLETRQETIIATRNAEISRSGRSGSTSFSNTTSSDTRRFIGNFNEEQSRIAAIQAKTEANRLAAFAAQQTATGALAAANAAAAAALKRADELQGIIDAIDINITNVTNVTNVDNRVTNIDARVTNIDNTVTNVDATVTNVTAVTRNVTNVTRNVTNLTQVTQVTQVAVEDDDDDGDDPLAQTFSLAGDKTAAGGAFLTSVDLYFESLDTVQPITVELRNVVNGYPGPKVLPFGRLIKKPADINTSSDASVATNFKFPSPVYVETETEYAIAVISNTPNHKMWIARMGETDVGGTRTISEQPHTGILFKSHNNTGWSISPLEDMKFTVYAANFNKSGSVVTLTNDDVPTQLLTPDSLSIAHSGTTLKVKHPDHGMYATTNNVTITGAKSTATTTLSSALTATTTTISLTSGVNFDDTSGIYSQLASGLWYIKIGDEIISYTAISTNTISGALRGVSSTTAAAHVAGTEVELYQSYKVPFTEINKTHTTISNIEIDSYTIATTTSAVVGASGQYAEFGGNAINATENAMMDYFSTMIGSLEVPGTNIRARALVTSATSPSGSQQSFLTSSESDLVPTFSFPLNDNFKFNDPYMITSTINETNELASQRSLQLQLTLSTNNIMLSPVIDVGRMSMLAVGNRLNEVTGSGDVYPTTEYVPSTSREGDHNAAIYITKQVTLATVAEGLKVIFAAHRPATADIKVLFKILKIDESTDFDDLGYTHFNVTGQPDATVSPATTPTDFQEYQFTAGQSDSASGAVGEGEPLEEFIAFQIKIVMTGTNCAEPPRIKQLRVLALGT
jgi:hypothetical protein